MMIRAWILAVLVATPAWAQGTAWPDSAVTYKHEVWTTPPMHLHIVTVDLSDPAVHVKVARGADDPRVSLPWETTLMPVTAMCQRDGLYLAVNGNFFMPKDEIKVMGRWVPYFPGNWARVSGWAMWDGHLYSQHPMDPHRPTLIVDAKGHVSIGVFDHLAGGAGQAVSGDMQIVTDGENSARGNPNEAVAPRTAVGIDRDAKKMILLVVDGRRLEYSRGMTHRELGDEMRRLGAWNAINLDGAGSSTLVMRDAQGNPEVMNRPSDGHDLAVDLSIPRSVANALGIKIERAATEPSTMASLASTPPNANASPATTQPSTMASAATTQPSTMASPATTQP
jgi:exopolysaccharide biosynthesis protein